MTDAAPTEIPRVDLTTLGLSLPLPPGWVARSGPATDEGPSELPVVVLPQDWPADRGFCPNLTVVGVPVAGVTTPHRAGTDAVAVLLQDQDSHLVSYDLWPGGRRLRRIVWVEEDQLVQEQWVLPLTDRVLTLTASVDVERWSSFGAVLAAMVQDARLTGEPAPEMAFSRRWGRAVASGGAAEPRRDLDLVELGENLEDLSRIAAHQRFRPSGVTVDREALVSWLRSEPAVRGEVPGLAELVGVDLAGADGRPTEAGARLLRIVSEADRVIQVEAATGLLPLSLSVYRRGGDAVVLCTDSPTQWLATELHGRALGEIPTRLHIIDQPTVAALGTLCSWLGVGPAWSLAAGTVDEQALLGRVQDPSTPAPAQATELLSQVWRRVSSLWTLRCEVPGSGAVGGLAAVSAGDRGHYLLAETDEEGVVDLQPLPSAALLDELVRLVVDPVEVDG